MSSPRPQKRRLKAAPRGSAARGSTAAGVALVGVIESPGADLRAWRAEQELRGGGRGHVV